MAIPDAHIYINLAAQGFIKVSDIPTSITPKRLAVKGEKYAQPPPFVMTSHYLPTHPTLDLWSRQARSQDRVAQAMPARPVYHSTGRAE